MNTKVVTENPITNVYRRVNIEEGEIVIERLLLDVYLQPGISTKELARKTLLPVPLVAAIKSEFIKEGLLLQDRGIRLSAAGDEFVAVNLGFSGIDKELYQQLLSAHTWEPPGVVLEPELAELERIFYERPQVDVTIDQSKATPLTSLKRAVLCLQNHSLIGKQIVCVGDDDLVSIAAGLLIKRLFTRPGIGQDGGGASTQIHVLDIDRRFLDHIQDTARMYRLPVICHEADLRRPVPAELEGLFDACFTDPPYTIPGMALFLSRGITLLKKKTGLPLFLSFAHKSPSFSLEMQQELLRMGLVIAESIPRFNQYEGAEIIGNTGQMIVLRTSTKTKPVVNELPQEQPLYTGELKRTLRTYQCQSCKQIIKVGFDKEYHTIEAVKKDGCPRCKNTIFDLVERSNIGRPTGEGDSGR